MQIAAKFSRGLGREITHIKLSEEQSYHQLLKSGLSDHYAKFLASLEVATANGVEERSNDNVEKVTGRPPLTFDAWVQENKAVWQ